MFYRLRLRESRGTSLTSARTEPGAAVDQLARNIEVPGVPSGFLDHVQQHATNRRHLTHQFVGLQGDRVVQVEAARI